MYTNLIVIVETYPEESPNAILMRIDCGVHYSMEHFDSNLKNLDYQIEDYQRILSNSKGIDFNRNTELEIEIENREYAKKKIIEIRDKYYDAKKRYTIFNELYKSTFELLAEQAVRNCLVEFEVAINNVYVAGRYIEDNNRIIITRENLIQSMRNHMDRVKD